MLVKINESFSLFITGYDDVILKSRFSEEKMFGINLFKGEKFMLCCIALETEVNHFLRFGTLCAFDSNYHVFLRGRNLVCLGLSKSYDNIQDPNYLDKCMVFNLEVCDRAIEKEEIKKAFRNCYITESLTITDYEEVKKHGNKIE